MLKKIFLFFFSVCVLVVFFAGNFRSTTTSNTAETVQTGQSSLYHFNVINTSTATIWVKLYDATVTPTFTNTPVITLQCEGDKQIWYGLNAAKNAPPVYNFQYGCYIRTVTGSADTYTVSPATSPIVEITTY